MLDIINAKNALRKIVNSDLPIKMAFELSSIVDDIENQLNKFEKFRISLFEKYGTKDKKGNISVEKDNLKSFNNEMDDLLNAEVNINIKPIKIDDVLSIDGLKLSIRDLKALNNIGLIDM